METPAIYSGDKVEVGTRGFWDLVLNRLQMLIREFHLPLHQNISRFSTDYWENISEDDYEIETI